MKFAVQQGSYDAALWPQVADDSLLDMSRYNMCNNLTYRVGCAKKYNSRVDSADTQRRSTVSSTSSNRRRIDASSTVSAEWVMIGTG